MLPGVPFVFAGMAIAAYADDFARIGRPTLIILGLMTIFALLIDFLAASVGARRAGASRHAITGAAIGTLLGLFMGPFGMFFGSFIGAVVGELIASRDPGHATRAGLAAWLGLFVGTLFKIAITFAMVGTFVAAWFVE